MTLIITTFTAMLLIALGMVWHKHTLVQQAAKGRQMKIKLHVKLCTLSNSAYPNTGCNYDLANKDSCRLFSTSEFLNRLTQLSKTHWLLIVIDTDECEQLYVLTEANTGHISYAPISWYNSEIQDLVSQFIASGQLSIKPSEKPFYLSKGKQVISFCYHPQGIEQHSRQVYHSSTSTIKSRDELNKTLTRIETLWHATPHSNDAIELKRLIQSVLHYKPNNLNVSCKFKQ